MKRLLSSRSSASFIFPCVKFVPVASLSRFFPTGSVIRQFCRILDVISLYHFSFRARLRARFFSLRRRLILVFCSTTLSSLSSTKATPSCRPCMVHHLHGHISAMHASLSHCCYREARQVLGENMLGGKRRSGLYWLSSQD
jgi:hypothetical protein